MTEEVKDFFLDKKIIEETIFAIFEDMCKLILKDSIDDDDFELCENTIKYTINYLRSKRKKQKKYDSIKHD